MPCRRRLSTLLKAKSGREGRGWCQLRQLEEELCQTARSTNQVAEVFHLIDGEDSRRRVLCPWRAHPLASTLPAVARATAGCLVRCEWLIGRVVCVPKSPACGFCVSCSPHGWPSVVRGLGHWRPRVGWTSDIKAVANWRAADTETAGWTSRNIYVTAYQPLTSHEAAGRRASNGRQGAGKREHPPGTEHPPRAILAVNERDDLNHLVRRSSHLAELFLQLAKMVTPASFSTGLALGCVDGLRPQGTQG